jgi:hypothetical protein
VASTAAWRSYAESLLPGLQVIHARTGLAAWVALAMAAHESGVPPAADSSYVLQRNPWGIGCSGQPGSCAVYPSLLAAADALPALLPANALAGATNPERFMTALQADDWSGTTGGLDSGDPCAPASSYAYSVLGCWGPQAEAALAAVGADVVTGQVAAAGGGGSGIAGPPPGPGAVSAAGIVAGVAAGVAGAGLLIWGLTR